MLAALDDIMAHIDPLDDEALAQARAKWNAVAKPIGSLGEFELMVEKIAGLTGSIDVDIGKRAVIVLCADNGVVAQGVSQSESDITTVIAGSVARGISSVCRMAQTSGTDAFSVDMGMKTPSDVEGVIDRSVARGTGDISLGQAMSRDQALEAVRTGIDLVGHFKDMGYKILATGEMGIGNTTTSSAMAAAFLRLPVEEVTGRGAGLSDAGLQRKIDAIERALAVNNPDPDDALDVLSKLGGFDIAGLAGMFIGGAVHRVPIVIDGFISALSAYTAAKLCPACTCAMLGSHVSAEPAARMLLEGIGVEPVIRAGLRLGEGTGAVLLFPLLDAALALYNGTTFDATGIEAYEVNPQ
ncbi:MAG: nicotinate-nucleotide--dimethylbenzimidazole phosphoribosyltransferase [Eggerthellaceae bacterium]|nr:nicotinate-nucleotide--dimethylbenzimidazole phosphoribosyltransferase [Eggerthellaceae bacterium]